MTRRVEWRGELFAADLDAARARLADYRLIPRRFAHTLTVFLHPPGEAADDLSQVIRLRAYADLPQISAEALAARLAAGLAGKLQAKSLAGEARPLGRARLTLAADGALRLVGADDGYRARSVRVARRLHHSFAPQGGVIGGRAEAMRVTVDLDRQLFRLEDDGGVTPLGQLGPRVEIKAPTQAAIDGVRRAINPDGLMQRAPNRSLELLLQDELRRRVTPAPAGFPEIEAKFDLAGGFHEALIDAALESLGEVQLLAPPPQRIERLRRYHVCRGPHAAEECTVVETPSGRLSEKRKRDSRRLNSVLLRQTSASRTTDRDGAATPLAAFLAERGWTALAMFEKRQTKIPFALPSGRAYLVSFDRCAGPDGRRLDQVELEFIGRVAGAASFDADVVAAELEALGARLMAGPLGRRLRAGAPSKHAFFSAPAPAPT